MERLGKVGRHRQHRPVPRGQVKAPPWRVVEEGQSWHPGLQQARDVTAGDQDTVHTRGGLGVVGESLGERAERLRGGTCAQHVQPDLIEPVKAA